MSALLVSSTSGLLAQSTNDASADDRLEAYLLDRGMLEMLAMQLEQRLDRTRQSRDRTAIAERLASVYAKILSDADSVDEQRRWESAATSLLDRVPDANTIELRLSLARAAYTRVESVAERYRLRMVDNSERRAAMLRLVDLRERFVAIARDADRRVRELEREEERAPRVDSGWLAEALAQARRQRSMAQYLAGWSSYFIAMLGDNPVSHASDAIISFGWLLGAERNTEPDLDGFSVESLRYEHIARAALATASCFGLRNQTVRAEQWFAILDDSQVIPIGLRDQLFSRRLSMHAADGNWAMVASLVSDQRGGQPLDQSDNGYPGGRPLSVSEARTLAIATFEAIEQRQSEGYLDWRVERLRDVALGDLVVLGQLGHVLDLASRYNTERFGDSSFVSLHVRGLALYQAARDLHEAQGSGEDPATDVEVIGQYRQAAELLEHALRADDAAAFADAMANTNLLIGLSQFYGGAGTTGTGSTPLFSSAADALEKASAQFVDPKRAADAMWMAIRALDSLDSARDGEALAVRRDELVKRFLQDYPDDEKSAALIIQLAESDNIAASERLSLLRAVPESNPLRESALRYAASLAYTIYRDGTSDDEIEFAAEQFSDLAEPLIAIDQRRGSAGDRSAQRAAVARARQVAEAVLSQRVPDLARAERVIDTLNRMLLDGFDGAEEAENEILFRAAQLALAKGDERAAKQIVSQLRETGEEFARPSVRVFYRDAAIEYERAIASNASADRVIASAERLISAGEDLLEQIEGEGTASDGEQAIAVGVRIRIGNAAQRVWQSSKDAGMLQLAFARFREVLQQQPRNVDALRGVARCGASAGEPRAALDAWRVLLSGLPGGSDEWFEARTEHLTLLSSLEPDRAREVLQQHAVLYPQLGPEPYRTRLLDIAAKLGISLQTGGGS